MSLKKSLRGCKESRSRILIVEDNEDQAMIFAAELQKLRHEVLCVYDGERALEEIRRNRPGLVIVNLLMPKLCGDEVVRRLRADPKTKDIWIILTSASPKGRALAKSVGADAFLQLPANLKTLRAMASEFLPAWRSFECG